MNNINKKKQLLINIIDEKIGFFQSIKKDRIKELPVNLIINTYIDLKVKVNSICNIYEKEKD